MPSTQPPPGPRTGQRAADFVSVVVPVLNESRFIEATVRSLLEQDYDAGRFEVIVVDGGSTDGTPDIVGRLAAAHPELRLLPNPGRLSSAGRNVGVRAARGDLIVIVDRPSDLPNPRYLPHLARAFP